MSDPQPLLRGGASKFEADLLRAGQADELSSTSRRRIMTGLGVGGGLLSATTIASGVNATSAKSIFATLGLGGAISAVSAVAIWAGISALSPAPPPPAPPLARAPVVSPSPPPMAPAPPPVAATVTDAPGDVAPLAAKAPVSRSAERSAETLSLELAALEQSRAALGRRDYSTALRLLDDYARRFPKRRLDSEATVLRIEALAARGDRTAATRVGNQFLATHANSPYARRVRSLIGARIRGRSPEALTQKRYERRALEPFFRGVGAVFGCQRGRLQRRFPTRVLGKPAGRQRRSGRLRGQSGQRRQCRQRQRRWHQRRQRRHR